MKIPTLTKNVALWSEFFNYIVHDVKSLYSESTGTVYIASERVCLLHQMPHSLSTCSIMNVLMAMMEQRAF